jgi:HTH-type transcriptional regulator/antitoxin MqsA
MDRLPNTEITMFRCHVCGNTTAKSDFVSEVFTIDGRRVLVEHIPAQVCEGCGEAIFSRETTERVRRLVRQEGQPSKTVSLDVFALA